METYGCSLNLSDTEFMEARLLESGFRPASSPEAADVAIINTCTVKERTWLNFLKRLKFYDKLRSRKGKGGRPALVIAGCIPAAMPEHPAIQPFVLIGPGSVSDIGDAAQAALEGVSYKSLKLRQDSARLNLSVKSKYDVISIIPIAAGCLGNCAYCQTRLARGSLYSYGIADIVSHAEKALSLGARELWLTAQDTGAWGKDLGKQLPDLLRALLEIGGRFRVRLGMANPNHVLDFLDELMGIFEDDRMYRFMHLPLQSGSDTVLSAMNRRYSSSQFLSICRRIREFDERFSLATDIIAGFPGETETDFQKTLDLLKEVRPAVVNRSRFSARPFTEAAEMDGYPHRIISDRSRRLSRLVEKISLEENQKWIGETQEVLVDLQKRKDSVISRNSYYKSTIINLTGHLENDKRFLKPGHFIEVRIIDAEIYHLKGEPEREKGKKTPSK